MLFTSFAVPVTLFSVALFAGQADALALDKRLADNAVDACNGSNNDGVGHSCAFKTADGTSQGTCQQQGAALICQPNGLTKRLADNAVDACNGSNHFGVGHSCAFKSAQGTSQGTCQQQGAALICTPPAAKRKRLADNAVDACNGKNNDGVGHSCAFKTADGTSQGTCQQQGAALICQPNGLTKRLADNAVDACNGKNNDGVGHSCAFSTPQGTSQGTCQQQGAALVCQPNGTRRMVQKRLADNDVDACNGSNHFGVGHSCAFKSAQGTAQGTCQQQGAALICTPPAAKRKRLADNAVDACNGSNHFGVGHSCAFKSAQGTSQGTCQQNGAALICTP